MATAKSSQTTTRRSSFNYSESYAESYHQRPPDMDENDWKIMQMQRHQGASSRRLADKYTFPCDHPEARGWRQDLDSSLNRFKSVPNKTEKLRHSANISQTTTNQTLLSPLFPK